MNSTKKKANTHAYHIGCEGEWTNGELKVNHGGSLVLVEHTGGNHGEEKDEETAGHTLHSGEV